MLELTKLEHQEGNFEQSLSIEKGNSGFEFLGLFYPFTRHINSY